MHLRFHVKQRIRIRILSTCISTHILQTRLRTRILRMRILTRILGILTRILHMHIRIRTCLNAYCVRIRHCNEPLPPRSRASVRRRCRSSRPSIPSRKTPRYDPCIWISSVPRRAQSLWCRPCCACDRWPSSDRRGIRKRIPNLECETDDFSHLTSNVICIDSSRYSFQIKIHFI